MTRPLAISVAVSGLSLLFAGGADAGDTVKFSPYGTVADQCAITAAGSTSRNIDLSIAGSDTTIFDIDCNLPIAIAVTAEHGAFQPETPPEHAKDHTASVDYVAGFTLPIASGVWAVSDATGASLTGAGRTFAPTGTQAATPPFDSTLTFRMAWDTPSSTLVAANYRETITITVLGRDIAPDLGF